MNQRSKLVQIKSIFQQKPSQNKKLNKFKKVMNIFLMPLCVRALDKKIKIKTIMRQSTPHLGLKKKSLVFMIK